jgi:glucose-6-phosphate dehydrogenase assembly protein OpcA
MASTDDLQELARWSDPSTDADAIQSALSRLWRQANGSRAASDGKNAMPGAFVRTRVANLVTYATGTSDTNRLAEELRELARRHPIRSLLLSAVPDSPEASISAAVRTYCRPSSGREVCFEHIQISSADRTGRRLASIVSQLLVHDLPTILWWDGGPSFTAQAFASLAPLADLLVFDTAELESAEEGLAALGNGLTRYRQQNAVADLNWNRLADWRELIAQFFDHDATLGLLDDIREVDIAIAPAKGSAVSAQALLLTAWLASRLGWEFDSADYRGSSLRIRMRHGRSNTTVTLHAVPNAHRGGGAVCSVRIDAGWLKARQRFTLSVDSGVCGSSSTEHAPGQLTSRRFSLTERSTADLMAEELEAFGREHALDDALSVAVALAERLRSIQPSRQPASHSA